MGDILPFDEVYGLLGTTVFKFVLFQVRDPAVAEDVTAEVFLSAYRAYDRTNPSADEVKPWLFRIARNKVVDHWRSQQRRQNLFLRLTSRGSATADIEQHAAMRDELRTAMAALNQMSARDRQIIALRVAAGMTHAEIGTVLGMSANATAVASGRALARFRRLVGAEDD